VETGGFMMVRQQFASPMHSQFASPMHSIGPNEPSFLAVSSAGPSHRVGRIAVTFSTTAA